MSLSRDILRRADIASVDLVIITDDPPITAYHSQLMRLVHYARAPNLKRVANGWEVRCRCGKKEYYFGTFLSFQRARIAQRLWEHWRAQGFDGDDIPRTQETR